MPLYFWVAIGSPVGGVLRCGLSSGRRLEVRGNLLQVDGLDVLDNMPLLAVKRYIPSFDVFPAPRSGWCDNLKSSFMVADNRFEADNNPAAQRL